MFSPANVTYIERLMDIKSPGLASVTLVVKKYYQDAVDESGFRDYTLPELTILTCSASVFAKCSSNVFTKYSRTVQCSKGILR